VEIPPGQYEIRTLWGKFEDAITKWEESINQRKMKEL
jgi:hypothetical protein